MIERSVGKPQKLKKKFCVFPKCGVEFIGRGKAKYCDEHRKAKYRKELYKQNDNKGEGIINIDHNELYAKDITRTCGLDGCDEEYTITLIPRLFEYSNYCENHRNPYKRERFVEAEDE